jgi:hypothetical protein
MEDRDEIIDNEALPWSRVKSEKENIFFQKLTVGEIKNRFEIH